MKSYGWINRSAASMARLWWPGGVLLVALAVTTSPTTAFNIDVSSAVVYQGEADSYFGFSVASHIDSGNGW